MHAVIFDIDGTLLQSASVDDALYRQSVESVVGPVRFRSSLAHYDYVTDSGILTQVLEDNSLPLHPDPTESIKSCFVGAVGRHIVENGPFPEVPGAKDLLESLRRSRNHAVAIATGGWRDSAELKLRSALFNIDGVPIEGSDAEHNRSHIMRAALSRLGSSFDSVTYYGDGPWDRDACLALNWDFVAVGPTLAGLESYFGIDIP